MDYVARLKFQKTRGQEIRIWPLIIFEPSISWSVRSGSAMASSWPISDQNHGLAGWVGGVQGDQDQMSVSIQVK